MVKRQMMCPNAECAKHGQATGLMGGCDCGTQLVPHKVEPTDEQLERTMMVMGVPAMTAVMMTQTPTLREGALAFHSLVQRAANGDPAANAKLAAIRDFYAQSEAA